MRKARFSQRFSPVSVSFFHFVANPSSKRRVSVSVAISPVPLIKFGSMCSLSAHLHLCSGKYLLMMALRFNSPASHSLYFKYSSSGTKLQNYAFSFRTNGICKTARPQISCVMNMTAGQSDEPVKLNFDHLMEKAKKLWDVSPQPVKSFPWERAFENFIQLMLDLILAVIKYLSLPVFFVSSVSEMSYCAHERKLFLIPFPFLVGAAVAGVLRTTALESSPSLRNAAVPWHLIAIAVFFTLLKLPGPYYPYWGRLFIPHLANGALFRTLWFAFLWYKRPKKPSETTTPDSVVGGGKEDKL